MAEVFGVAAGALSVAAIFTDCVECFEYIQLGRRFSHDYERCHLKLDIAQTRLTRWGAAVAVHEEPLFATGPPSDNQTQQIQLLFQQIYALFQFAQQTSKRYELDTKPEDRAVWEDRDMRPFVRQARGRLEQVVRQRQKQTSFVKKVRWALYDAKNFDRLVEQITGFLDDLERLWPAEEARRQLARVEVEGVDELALAALLGASEGVDPVLGEAAKARVVTSAARNHGGKISAVDDARVRVGNEFSETFRSFAGLTDETTNTANEIDARKQARVHVGTIYGGRGIFDD